MPDDLTAEQHLAEADRLTRDWDSPIGLPLGEAITPVIRAQWHLLRAQILRETPAQPTVMHFEVGDYPNGDRDWVSVGRCHCGATWPCPVAPTERHEEEMVTGPWVPWTTGLCTCGEPWPCPGATS